MGRRLLIFDFDGTLADTFGLFLDVFDEAAALYRFEPFDMGNLDYLRTLDARSILQYHRVPAWKLPIIAQTMRKLMESHVESIRLFAGIESTIANLRDRGATLALLSSTTPHKNILRCSINFLSNCHPLINFSIGFSGDSLDGSSSSNRIRLLV